MTETRANYDAGQSPDRLEEIKARLEAATPGPFQPDECDACIVRKVGGYAVAQFFPQAGMDDVPLYDAEANAELFINAAADIVHLLAEVEQAHEDMDYWGNQAMSLKLQYDELAAENKDLRRQVEQLAEVLEVVAGE